MFWLNTSKVKTFSNKYSYKISKLKELGKGRNRDGVYLYQIEILGNKLNQTVFLAGKFIEYHKKRDYEDNFVLLKKNKLIKYSVRKFEIKSLNIECINFERLDLKDIFFITDLTENSNYELYQINDSFSPNSRLFRILSDKQKEQLFRRIFDDLLKLSKVNYYIHFFDIWLVRLNRDEIETFIVDLDFLQKFDKTSLSDALNPFFNNLSIQDSLMMYNIFNEDRYKGLFEFYEINSYPYN